jgi:DNA-binding transcriptional LysR family regulator
MASDGQSGELHGHFRRSHLRYFVAVADERQITRAAVKLNIAQPALSRAINDLESQLGLQLFERHARGVTLTRAGESLYVKARDAVDAIAEATMLAQALARSVEQTLVFGFFGTPPALHSPELVGRFAQARPAIDVVFHELTFPGPDASVWLEDVDLVLCHQPPPHPAVWVAPLRSEPRVVLARRDHPLGESAELSLEQCLDERYVGFDGSVDPEWAGFFSFDDHRGARANATRDRARNPQEVLAAVSKGQAITAMPRCHAEGIAERAAAMVVIPVRDAEPCLLCLAGRSDRLSAPVAELRSRLQTPERPLQQALHA